MATLLSDILWRLLVLVGSYLLGSILFAKIMVKIFAGKDIEQIGDKNPGAKNTMLHVNFALGFIAGTLDILKAWAPTYLLGYFFWPDLSFSFCAALGAVLGHMYPLYNRFKGGRVISCLIGSFFFFIPYEIIWAAIIVGLIYLVKFLLKKNFLISLSKLMLATAVVSFFIPHDWIIKLMVFGLLVAGFVFNKANWDSSREWFSQVIQTVRKN